MASSASPTFSESVGCDDRERRGSLGELLRTFVTSLFVIAPFTDVKFIESELTAFESVSTPVSGRFTCHSPALASAPLDRDANLCPMGVRRNYVHFWPFGNMTSHFRTFPRGDRNRGSCTWLCE
jgi:hypothetical protein